MVPQACVALIKKHEGFKSEPYLCPAKIPTIGYGFTTYPDGTYVTLNDKALSQEEAEKMLAVRCEKLYIAVTSLAPHLNENQLSALTSFAYNVGLSALKTSTLFKLIKENPAHAQIRYEFTRWNKANGLALAGLTKRRKEEANLYFS